MKSYLNSIFDKYCEQNGRLEFVDGIREIEEIARSRNVSEKEIQEYAKDLSGLIIKKSNKDKDFIIVLRKEVPDSIRDKTIGVLKGQGFDPALDLYAEDKRYLHAFILLHEIAHYVHSHGPTCLAHEIEANEWALEEFQKNLSLIRPQPVAGGDHLR